MEQQQLVQKLQDTTGVTADQARAALEAAGWDPLDALLVLQRQGIITEVGHYTSKNEAGEAELPPEEKEQVTMIDKIFSALSTMLQYGNRNSLYIEKNARRVLALPVTVFVLLLIFTFWVTVPLLVVGLFFGYHYSFIGPDMHNAGNSVNQVIDRVGDAASSMAQEFTAAYNSKKEAYEQADTQGEEAPFTAPAPENEDQNGQNI